MSYPKYSELTDNEKKIVNNGCGPDWMPEWAEKIFFAWMFEAQCGHHDWGYLVGGDEKRRLECDLKFGKALAKDATRNLINAVIGTLLVLPYFLSVLICGRFFFRYGIPFSKAKALNHVRQELNQR